MEEKVVDTNKTRVSLCFLLRVVIRLEREGGKGRKMKGGRLAAGSKGRDIRRHLKRCTFQSVVCLSRRITPAAKTNSNKNKLNCTLREPNRALRLNPLLYRAARHEPSHLRRYIFAAYR